jgi:hypothetical protein
MRRWRALPAAETAIDIDMVTIMRKMRIRRMLMKPLCFVLALGLGAACGAHPTACLPRDAEAADAAVDELDSWIKIASTFKKYGHCDAGSIAEGNSEAVARLLVDHWSTLPMLASRARRDPAFKRFVLRHIDTTLDTNDLGKIKAFASSQCPKGAAALCSELLAAAERAAR